MKEQKVTTGIYGIAPIAICQDGRVTFNELKTFIAIASFQGTNDASFPSRESIAERAGLTVQAVSTATAGLVEKGWLSRIRRFNGTTIYRCLTPVVPQFKRRQKGGKLKQKSESTGQLAHPNQSDIDCPIGSDISYPNESEPKRTIKRPSYKNKEKVSVVVTSTPDTTEKESKHPSSSRPEEVTEESILRDLDAWGHYPSAAMKIVFRPSSIPANMHDAFRGAV